MGYSLTTTETTTTEITTTEEKTTEEKTTETKTTKENTDKKDVTISDAEKAVEFQAVNASGESIATTDETTGVTTVSIKEAGGYTLSGYTENLEISVKKETSTNSENAVVINLDNLVVDNSQLTSDESVISVGKDNANVVINISGTNKIVGAKTYTDKPAALISVSGHDKVSSVSEIPTLTLTGESGAALSIMDSMSEDTDYGSTDPADGISSKGAVIIESGTYNIYTNGDCIKGTGSVIADGDGGVTVKGGTLNLTSYLGNGIKSKSGVITISGGTVNSNYTYEDAINAKNYTARITGGTVNIDNCYGDGIQGENVDISAGTVNIKTYYEYAGKNFYDTSLGAGNYNILTKGNDTKTETVNVDTGSHKGIKAGTKAKTYSYTTVADGSTNTAGTTYTQNASGGLIISGGTINIDTTKTGIKYNGSAGGNAGGGTPPSDGFGGSGNQGGGGTPPSGNPGGSGNGGFGGNSGNSGTTTDSNGQVAAVSDGGDVQYIIGCPEDGIHSNNTTSITGGNITIAAADDGISSAESLNVTGDNTVINITTAYEGIESGTITVGTNGETSGPTIYVYTNDDGINAAKKSNVTYVYADEDEEKYTKTSTSAAGNTMEVYSGKVTVEIGDDQTHTVTLPNKGSSDTSITYSSDGDGIDCNGSFYAYDGTVVVYGASSGSNSPIDVDTAKVIGEGAVVLEIGSISMMDGNISETYSQPYVTYSNANVTSGQTLGITNGSTDYLTEKVGTITTKKSASYVLFSAPNLTKGTSYTLTGGATAQTESAQ